MSLGLVSKARKERQLASLKANKKIWEETRANWANMKIKSEKDE